MTAEDKKRSAHRIIQRVRAHLVERQAQLPRRQPFDPDITDERRKSLDRAGGTCLNEVHCNLLELVLRRFSFKLIHIANVKRRKYLDQQTKRDLGIGKRENKWPNSVYLGYVMPTLAEIFLDAGGKSVRISRKDNERRSPFINFVHVFIHFVPQDQLPGQATTHSALASWWEKHMPAHYRRQNANAARTDELEKS